MTQRTTTIIWVIVGIIVLGATAYYFFVVRGARDQGAQPTFRQTDAEIIRRLTADLNRQSTSTRIADIQADLDATDFSILTEGLPQ